MTSEPAKTDYVEESANISGQSKNPDGELPPPYANTKAFWIDLFAYAVLGAVVGGFGFCWLSVMERFTTWYFEDFDRNDYLDINTWDFGDGQSYWPGISAGFGLLVGLGRVVLKYPEEVPTFMAELQSRHADFQLSCKTCFLGLLSLMGGLTVGPEAPLGAIGAGTAQLLADKVGCRWGMDSKMAVYVGMAAAFSALFPSPIFAVLMILELGIGTWHPDELWKQVTHTTVGAVAAFAVFKGAASSENTYLHNEGGTGAAGLALGWEIAYIAYAIPLGVYSALVGTLSMLFYKVVEKVFSQIRGRCMIRFNPTVVTVLFPVLVGALSGALNIGFPLSIGDGAEQLDKIIKDGPAMGVGILIANAFAKLFCLGMAQGSGFVGGFFFPMFFVGAIAGILAHLAFPPSTYSHCLTAGDDLSDTLTVSDGTGQVCIEMNNTDGLNKYFAAVTCLVAVPAAFVPFPFTLTLIAGFMMQMTSYQVSSVYFAVMISYTLISGTGLPQRLQKAKDTTQPIASKDSLNHSNICSP